jgi:hypothetical protein
VRAGQPSTVQAVLLREREVAIVLGVSASQVGIYRRQGLLTPIRLPGIRAVRYARGEVERLAERWCSAAGVGSQQETSL